MHATSRVPRTPVTRWRDPIVPDDLWAGIRVPERGSVLGVSWSGSPHHDNDIAAIVYFAPRSPDVALSPVAERLGFIRVGTPMLPIWTR